MARRKASVSSDPMPESSADVSPAEAIEASATEHPAESAPASIDAMPAEMVASGLQESCSAPDDDIAANRRRKARGILRRYMVYSGAAGLLPLPLVDIATVTGLQVKMLHVMTRLYGVPFDSKLARQLVLALVGGGSVALSMPIASATKAVPVVGIAGSFLLSPAFASVSCYGIGRAFIGHFEAGGTLDTFTADQPLPGVVAS